MKKEAKVKQFDFEKFKEYVITYPFHNKISNEGVLKDMLYGLGLSVDYTEYKYADGFKRFQKFIKTLDR